MRCPLATVDEKRVLFYAVCQNIGLLQLGHTWPIDNYSAPVACLYVYATVCTDIAVRSLTCHTATETHTPHGITQCHLPPDRGDVPFFTHAEAGTRLSDPRGMQGWVDLVGLLHTEMMYPPEDGHPSKY